MGCSLLEEKRKPQQQNKQNKQTKVGAGVGLGGGGGGERYVLEIPIGCSVLEISKGCF